MGLLFLILPAAPRQQLVSGSTLNSGSTRRLELLGQSSADTKRDRVSEEERHCVQGL